MAHDAKRDTGLRLLDASGLFARNTSHIAVRQGRYLRGYAYRFLELCSPDLTESIVQSSITPKWSQHRVASSKVMKQQELIRLGVGRARATRKP